MEVRDLMIGFKESRELGISVGSISNYIRDLSKQQEVLWKS